jgi:hypothetical protein
MTGKGDKKIRGPHRPDTIQTCKNSLLGFRNSCQSKNRLPGERGGTFRDKGILDKRLQKNRRGYFFAGGKNTCAGLSGRISKTTNINT